MFGGREKETGFIMVAFWLVLVSLAFYGIGAVTKAGKSADLKPRLADLFVLMALWAAAICAAIFLSFSNRWILPLLWMAISAAVGAVSTSLGRLPPGDTTGYDEPKPRAGNILKRAWGGWKDFSTRLGGFQTRVILSLGFFIIGPPIILFARRLNDPLILKMGSRQSHWLPRDKSMSALEQFRKQF